MRQHDAFRPAGRSGGVEIIAGSRGAGTTASKRAGIRNISNALPNVMLGIFGGQSWARAASQNTSLASASRKMKWMVSRGNLKFTGTAISPARMMP